MKHARRAALLALCLLLLACLSSCAQDRSRAYDKALGLFASEDYAGAAAAFNRLNGYAESATYAAYSHGLVLYEQGQYAAAEPYFETCRSFMYGEQRYQYCHAHGLMQAGQWAQAEQTFAAAGEFEDAPVQAQYCLARAAEERKDYETALFGYEAALGLHDAEDRLYNLQGQLYNRAIALKKEERYEDAMVLFNLLGDYLSSVSQSVECNNAWLDQRYSTADALEAQGDLQGAFELFHSLSSYRDAAARAQELATKLGIVIEADE